MKDFSSEKIVLVLAQLNLLQLQTAFEWDKQNSWVKRGKDGRFGSGGSSIVSAPKERITDNTRVRESLSKVGIDPNEAEIALQRLESRPKDFNPAYAMFLLPFQREYAQSVNLKQQDLDRLQIRIKEIDKLVNSKNWETNRDLAWRVGVVKSEIKYGDLINKVVDIDLPDSHNPGLKPLLDMFVEDKAAHKALLIRLNKGTTGEGIKEATKEESGVVQEFIRAAMSKTKDGNLGVGFTEIEDKEKRKKLIKSAIKPGMDFQKLIYEKLDVILDAFMDRGFTTDSETMRNGSRLGGVPLNLPSDKEFRYINVGNYNGAAVKFVMNHELGHALEKKLDQSDTARKFIETRATSRTPMDLKNYGMPGEFVIQDKFSHPYTGKIYPRQVSNMTEVVSTATQSLTSPSALSTQAYLDREHIMYGLSVMDMKQGDRFPGGEA